MVQNVKKILANDGDAISIVVANQFKQLGLEIVTEYNSIEKDDYLFVINEFRPEVTDLTRLKTQYFFKKKLEQNFFDFSYINNKTIVKIFNKVFHQFNNLDFIDRLTPDNRTIFTIKIQDDINVGSYIDSIIYEASKLKYKINKIRYFLSKTIDYLNKVTEDRQKERHYDVSFSFDEELFVVQLTTQLGEFDLMNDLLSQPELLHFFNEATNLLDLCFVKDRQHLKISAGFFKNELLENFKSRQYTQIETRAFVKRPLTPRKLPERLGKLLHEPNTSQKRNVFNDFELVRNAAIFIQKKRQIEPSPVDFNLMAQEHFDLYLNAFEKENNIESIDFVNKEVIFDLLKNKRIDIDEVDKIVAKISSNPEILQDVLKIKGKIEGNEDLEIIKVKGQEALEDIKNDLYRIYGSKDICESDLIKVLASPHDDKESDIKKIISGIFEYDDKFKVVVSSKFDRSELEVAELAKEIEISSQKFTKATEQNLKMKAIVDQLKNELVRLRQAAALGSSTIGGDKKIELELSVLNEKNNLLEKTNNLLKMREAALKKASADFESIIFQKDLFINQLEKKIELFKENTSAPFASTSDATHLDKIKKLEEMNLKLQNELNIRSLTLSGGGGSNNQEELEAVKQQLLISKQLIDKLKGDKNEVEKKVLEFNLFISHMLESKGGTHQETLARMSFEEKKSAFIEELSKLKASKKLLDEKVKDFSLQSKKYEHRIKMQHAQLEELARKKPGNNNKSSDAAMRLVENANTRINDLSTELNEKKMEVIRSKTENLQLISKISDLERKLMYFEKKSA